MPRFSIIFPAYKSPGTIFDNIEKIYAESKDVEFLVGPEAWNDEDMGKLEKMAEKYPIKIRAHKEKRGKVAKLNELINISSGDILIFMDNDVEIISENFLKALEKSMERGDFGSGKIYLVGDSWTQRGARIDYLGINAAIAIQEITGISLGINGALIVAKREVVEKLGGFRHVITEDSDFGCRASEAGFKPVFAEEAEIATDAPETWAEWYKQRKRWAIGEFQTAALNRKFHIKHLIESIAQSVAVFPFWVPAILYLIGPGPLAPKLAFILTAAISTIHPIFLLLAYVSFLAMMITQPITTILGLSMTAIWVWYWRKKLKFWRIKPADIIFYYFVYAPIWGALLLGALTYVAIRSPNIKECCGWKA